MEQEITATFLGATRKLNSANGNPTWMLHTSDGDYQTRPDAAVGYDVENRLEPEDGWVGKSVVFTVEQDARRVSGVRRVIGWRLSE